MHEFLNFIKDIFLGSKSLAFQQIQEHSVALLFLSAVIGGIVGASLKMLFEVILTDKYMHRREARSIIAKYRNPILRSADALRGRIANFLTTYGCDWFGQSEYYRLSTLYVFCQYFAWCELLFGRLTLLRFESSQRNRKLNNLLLLVEKSFNNRNYFNTLPIDQIPDDTDVPKFICKALGEISVNHSNTNEPCCIDFIAFCAKYRDDKVFRCWLGNLESFLSGVKNDENNLKWDRLHIIQLSLIGLINFMDPKHELTRPYRNRVTKNLLNRIHHTYAREMLCSDVAEREMPILLERRVTRFWRYMARPLTQVGILSDNRRKTVISTYCIPEIELNIPIDLRNCDLSNKVTRALLYNRIVEKLRADSATISFDSNKPMVLIIDKEVDSAVRARIPHNICSISAGLISEDSIHIQVE